MNKKIRIKSMFGTHHSWTVTMKSLASEMLKLDQELYIISTDGYNSLDDTWKDFINKDCISPDIDLCYTLPLNFKTRFNKDSKLKLAIYNYETSILPASWKDDINYVDYVLPSSNFSKEIFVNAGWPENKCIVVPHGIHLEEFKTEEKLKLKNDKSFRFLNISIPHYRKNIDILLSAYYSAFTEDDDVCLVIKTSLAAPKGRKRYDFEADVMHQISEVQKKFKNKKLPQLEINQDRLNNIVPLYNSCDVLVSASSCEGFGLPLLEGLAANKIVIAPRCTGQLDFLNDNNSLLVDANIIAADKKYQYWTASKGATTFQPDVNSLANAMLRSFNERDELLKKFEKNRVETINKFTWENAAKQILSI